MSCLEESVVAGQMKGPHQPPGDGRHSESGDEAQHKLCAVLCEDPPALGQAFLQDIPLKTKPWETAEQGQSTLKFPVYPSKDQTDLRKKERDREGERGRMGKGEKEREREREREICIDMFAEIPSSGCL